MSIELESDLSARLREMDGMDVGTLPFLDYTACIPDWYTPLLATAASTLDEDPAMVRAFLDVLSRGYQAAMQDPSKAADALLAAAPELDPALVRASAEYLATRYADDADAWGRQTPETWGGFVAFLQGADLLEDGFDTGAAWTNDYLPER